VRTAPIIIHEIVEDSDDEEEVVKSNPVGELASTPTTVMMAMRI
jgi:hypothetical protein